MSKPEMKQDERYTYPAEHPGWAFNFNELFAPDRPELFKDMMALNSSTTPNRSELLIKWFKRTLVEQPANSTVDWRNADPAKVPLLQESRAVIAFMAALTAAFPTADGKVFL